MLNPIYLNLFRKNNMIKDVLSIDDFRQEFFSDYVGDEELLQVLYLKYKLDTLPTVYTQEEKFEEIEFVDPDFNITYNYDEWVRGINKLNSIESILAIGTASPRLLEYITPLSAEFGLFPRGFMTNTVAQVNGKIINPKKVIVDNLIDFKPNAGEGYFLYTVCNQFLNFDPITCSHIPYNKYIIRYGVYPKCDH